MPQGDDPPAVEPPELHSVEGEEPVFSDEIGTCSERTPACTEEAFCKKKEAVTEAVASCRMMRHSWCTVAKRA